MIETASPGVTMTAKYTLLAELIQATLGSYQIATQTGSVAAAYCPGSFDLSVQGRKIAGMSQYWFRNRCGIHCLVAAASINVEQPPDLLSRLVNQFYISAGSPFRCRATALTNMRLCGATAHLAGEDLAEAVMNQFGSCAAMLGV